MKKFTNVHSVIVTITLSFVLLLGCESVRAVAFKRPVGTTNKVVANQIKKTYKIENLDLYVSNEFDGARLSGVKKENDSTVIVAINPENTSKVLIFGRRTLQNP